MNKGKKRYVPEEIVEKKVVSSKKQKIVDAGDGVAKPYVEKNKGETKTKKSFKKRKSSSNEVEEKKIKRVAPKNKVKKEPKPSSKKQSAKKRATSTSDESESLDSSDSTSDDEPQTLATPEAFRSNYMFMDNLSHSIEEKDVLDFFKDTGKVVSVSLIKLKKRLSCFGHVRFDTAETAQKAHKHNGEELFGQAVELELIEERCDPGVKPPNKWYTYLFMGNLSPSIQKEDVLDFFKDAGKIRSVYFDSKYGRLSGSGHVNFSTTEAAQKGLKRNKEMLLGHAVELVLATHASVWYSVTPNCTNRRKRGPLGIYIGRGYGPTL